MTRCAMLGGMLFLVVGSGCARSSSALIDRIAEGYGGAGRLSKEMAVKETGTVLSPRFPGKVGSIIRGTWGPRRMRVEIVFPGEIPEVRIVSGDRVWRQGAPASGPPRDAAVLQAYRLALPGLLLDRRGEVQERDEVERDGRRFRVLVIPLEGNMSLAVEVDPGTGRIVRSTGTGEGIELITGYSDFREVDGRLFAFQEVNTAMGQQAGEIRLHSVEVTDSFPPEVFQPW